MILWLTPGSFRSSWNPVMPCFRAANFVIHVAEMIFGADDVGEEFVALHLSVFAVFRDEADADSSDRVLIGTPASMSASIPPQTLAIELEPFDSMISLVMRTA